MAKKLPTWIQDLFSGVSEEQLQANILSYGGDQLPVNLEFIILDNEDHSVELDIQNKLEEPSTPELFSPVPSSVNATFLCTDILKNDKLPRYTQFDSIEEYNRKLAQLSKDERDNIAIRSLVKVGSSHGQSVEDIKEFFTAWSVFDKESFNKLAHENMQDIFAANPPSIAKVAIGAAAGDAIFMGLSLALSHYVSNFRQLEIASACALPAVITIIASYITYRSELNSFEAAEGRKANPAEIRALRKRAIDIGWQTLFGMIGWTTAYYVAPVIASAIGWAAGGPGAHLIGAILTGLGQAIFTTVVDYQQQRREVGANGKTDYPRLAAVFATEFVAGFGLYAMCVMIPAQLAKPLGHLVQPALTAISMLVVSAAVATITLAANAIIPYAPSAFQRLTNALDMSKVWQGLLSLVSATPSKTMTSSPSQSGTPPVPQDSLAFGPQ